MTDDPRIFGRTLRDFKIQAETQERAIQKYSELALVATRKTKPGQNVIPIRRLSEQDILELFDICDYNYALHMNAEEVGNED